MVGRLLEKIFVAIMVVLLCAIAVLAWPRFTPPVQSGHFVSSRVEKVEHLTDPVPITGWMEKGFQLADGRIVQLPGFSKLPAVSAALTEVSLQGLELNTNGRVYGLIRIWHWCGDDPIGREVARVDVADLLACSHSGEISTTSEAWKLSDGLVGRRFSNFGLDVDEYSQFKLIESIIDRNRHPDTKL